MTKVRFNPNRYSNGCNNWFNQIYLIKEIHLYSVTYFYFLKKIKNCALCWRVVEDRNSTVIPVQSLMILIGNKFCIRLCIDYTVDFLGENSHADKGEICAFRKKKWTELIRWGWYATKFKWENFIFVEIILYFFNITL